MGLHTGEPSVGGERYVGLGVHRAARICAAAHGGQVLVAAVTRDLVEDELPADVGLADLGEHRLKDLDRPERLSQLVIDGLRRDFPPPRTAGAVPQEGRERELAQAAQSAVSAEQLPAFRILGPLEVVGEDGLLPLGGQKQKAVLAILLLNAGRAVGTDHLIDALWGGNPPRTAATSLQNLVSQLRKLVGAEALATQPPGYVLRIEPEQIDFNRFNRLVAEARSVDAEERAGLLRAALALWRGAPLADFAYDAFAQNEIGRLEEARLNAIEQRIDADLELGRHDELVGELEAIVAEHQLRERPRAQLMLALYRGGRQAEALQAFQDARRALVEELGIEPSPPLQQLHAAILRQEGSLQPRSPARAVEDHYDEAVRALAAARLVTVLGPDAGMPPARDVAAHLAVCFGLDHEPALTKISQHILLTQGVGPLYDELHALFKREQAPAPVHRFLASLPPLLRARGLPQQLVVSTAYDHTLEHAFEEAGEELDVVAYIADGPDRGKFLHVPADGLPRVIDEPNAYASLDVERRPVLLKIHGQADRDPARVWDSFVVSEDDYIDYLTHAEVASVIPVTLVARLRRSHFLFLGYGLEDWNLRVFLRRVWGRDRVTYRSWAVEPTPGPLAHEFWRERDVEVFVVPLDEYVGELRKRAEELLAPEVPA
jgi:DNA-binding SARP family transcriptional activator